MSRARLTAWIVWIVLAAAAATGLPRLRVSNSLEAWMPDLATPGPFRAYVVSGFESSVVSSALVTSRLRAIDDVSFCVDPTTVRMTSLVTGTSPEEFVVSRDGTYAGIFCFARDPVDSHQFVNDIRSALDEMLPRESFALGGPVVFEVAMDEWSQARLPFILPAILVGGCAVLLAITRSIRVSLVAVAAISLSLVVFAGAVCWLNIPMDMSVALVPPLMIGLGFSYAAHRALRRESLGILVVCGLAALVGMLSYATADLKPVRTFALAGTPGLLLVWLATVTLVHHDPRARRLRVPWVRACRDSAIASARRSGRWIALVAILICCAGLVMARSLLVESNPLEFFPADSRVSRDFRTLNDRLTGMLPSAVVVTGDIDPREQLGTSAGVRKVIDLTPWVGGEARTYLLLANNDAADTLAEQAPGWEKWAREQGGSLSWHGVAAQLHRAAVSIHRLTVEAVPSLAILMSVFVLLLFRSGKLAIVGIIVLFVPVAALVTFAVLTSWKLDPVTLVIGSITTGVTVDDLIQLLSTAKRRQSMTRAMIECWKPCFGSSLASAMCFGLFALSPFGPTAQFGIMMALATLFALVTNQLILPAVASQLRCRFDVSPPTRARVELGSQVD